MWYAEQSKVGAFWGGVAQQRRCTSANATVSFDVHHTVKQDWFWFVCESFCAYCAVFAGRGVSQSRAKVWGGGGSWTGSCFVLVGNDSMCIYTQGGVVMLCRLRGVWVRLGGSVQKESRKETTRLARGAVMPVEISLHVQEKEGNRTDSSRAFRRPGLFTS